MRYYTREDIAAILLDVAKKERWPKEVLPSGEVVYTRPEMAKPKPKPSKPRPGC